MSFNSRPSPAIFFLMLIPSTFRKEREKKEHIIWNYWSSVKVGETQPIIIGN